MRPLKRIRYNTMNSWNLSTAPAYNLKVHNVIDHKLQDKVYALMEAEGFYDNINDLIAEFDASNNYEYQAGFNGRSGGYLVLYRGGRKLSQHKSRCTVCGQRNFTEATEQDNKCGNCGANARVNHTMYETFTYPGKAIEENEVPADVLKAFKKLAVSIVKEAEYMAKQYNVEDEEYTVVKTRKVMV